MARRPQDVTDAELEVLRGLWEHGPATIRATAGTATASACSVMTAAPW